MEARNRRKDFDLAAADILNKHLKAAVEEIKQLKTGSDDADGLNGDKP